MRDAHDDAAAGLPDWAELPARLPEWPELPARLPDWAELPTRMSKRPELYARLPRQQLRKRQQVPGRLSARERELRQDGNAADDDNVATAEWASGSERGCR